MKVMTLNLNWYEDTHGPWPIRRELIAQVIRERRADVIALQAVRKDPNVENGVDQASQLADALPEYKHVVFVPAAEHGTGRQDGSAWLSCLPLERLEHQCLPLGPQSGKGLQDPAQRLVLYARIGTVSVFNCRFSWVYAQAVANIESALPFLRRVPGPHRLVGDFNTTPDTDLIRRLSAEGFHDVWAHLHPHEPGYTFESHAPAKPLITHGPPATRCRASERSSW